MPCPMPMTTSSTRNGREHMAHLVPAHRLALDASELSFDALLGAGGVGGALDVTPAHMNR